METEESNDGEDSTAICETCLFPYKNKRVLKKHRCLITIVEEEPDFFIRDEEELSRLMKAVKHFGSSGRNLIRFCESTKSVAPGLYPMFFPSQSKNSYPNLIDFGSVGDSYSLLMTAAREGPVKLRKSLKIKSGDKVFLFHSSLLLPSGNQKLKSFNIIDKNS